MKFSEALPTDSKEELFKKWEKYLAKKELCSIVCVPFSGREYRIENFQTWLKSKRKEIHYIHIKLEQVSHPEDISKIFNSTDKPLIFSPAELLLTPESESILTAITQYKHRFSKGVLLFFEASLHDITSTANFNAMKLLQNVGYLPLLSENDSRHFCLHLAERWNLEISDNIIRDIYKYTGGQMWLIKEILRQYSDHPRVLSKIFQSEQMQYKKEKIWKLLPENYKEFICSRSVNKINGIQLQKIILELQHLHILDKKSRIIPEFILEFTEKIQIDITTTDTAILFNKIPISSFLSNTENQILRAILEAPSHKISREKLAKTIWNNLDYSDWALDKAISRLRNKLQKLGIPKKCFVTIREHGYQLILDK